jgi:hypothetical protein
MSSKRRGPLGNMRPSRPSSSLSTVRELETLGLRAETEELLFDFLSRLVPPNLVPKLPSPHSSNSSWTLAGVLGISFLADSLSGSPTAGSWKSISKSSSGSVEFCPFRGVGGVIRGTILEGCRIFATLIASPPSPKKASSSSSRNRSKRLDEPPLGFNFGCGLKLNFGAGCNSLIGLA